MTAKRRKWWFVLGGVVIAIALFALINQDNEPSYQGRSLSRWLALYATAELDDTPGNQTVRVAIQHMGTNALPFLLTWVRYEPPRSGVRPTLRALVRKLPDDLAPQAVEDWGYTDSKELLAERAAAAFAFLDEQVQPAIPALAQLMNDPTRPMASERAVFALGYAGPPASPVLLAQLAQPNAPHRRTIAMQFSLHPNLAQNPEPVVTLLVRCLEDQDSRVRIIAAHSLGRIAERSPSYAALVVPALTNCLGVGSSPALRRYAVRALGNYGDQAQAAVPILLRITADPEEAVRIQATNALKRIAPEVLTNAPAN